MDNETALKQARELLNKTDHMLTSGEECNAIAAALKRAFADGIEKGQKIEPGDGVVLSKRIRAEADQLEGK